MHTSPTHRRTASARRRPYLISLLLLLAALAVLAPTAQQLFAQPTQPRQNSRTVYLPLISKPARQNVFGATFRNFDENTGMREAQELQMSWLRGIAIEWMKVQPTEGAPYNWASQQEIEARILRANRAGVRPIIIVNRSPRWATTVPSGCGPIKPEAYDDFAAFMAAAVARYSQPPFNVQFWEIGNEPDIDWISVGTDSGFGCWGSQTDKQFYGGERYGAMLRVIYPAIKAVDPGAQVMIGGLLLSGPTNNPNEGNPHYFLRGILEAQKNDPRPSFDIVSFHGYGYYNYSFAGTDFFGRRGGFVIGKAAYLRDEMAAYGRNVPLINTETALLCGTSPLQNPDCRPKQADYVARIYVETMVANLLGSLWYEVDTDEFYNTSLVDPVTRAPRPSYLTYKATVEQLGTAVYVGRVPNQPSNVTAYNFNRNGKTLLVAWSDANATLQLNLPPRTTVVCKNRDAAVVPCQISGGVLTYQLSRSPIYVEFP